MALRKYQAYSNQDDRLVSTGDGFQMVRGRSLSSETEPPVFTISATEGEEVSATITGEHPNWHIELVLRRGEKGDTGSVGPQGPQGPAGVCDCDCCNDPECPPAGTVISVSPDRVDIYYDAGCGQWTIGYDRTRMIADGNCGQNEETYQEWNTGDIGTCNGYIYSVDSSGNVTSRPENQCPEGYYWNGISCEPINNGGNGQCPAGYYWDGTSCQPEP